MPKFSQSARLVLRTQRNVLTNQTKKIELIGKNYPRSPDRNECFAGTKGAHLCQGKIEHEQKSLWGRECHLVPRSRQAIGFAVVKDEIVPHFALQAL